MLHLTCHLEGRPLRRVLCLGAHADDIEIGCGATLLHLAREYPETRFYWAVFTARGERAAEAAASAKAFVGDALEAVALWEYADGFLPFAGAEVKACFEQIKRAFVPDLVFTHYREDRHQDHRLVSDLTWNTFRDQLILEYEIPKFDGDLGRPNGYVACDAALLERKIALLTATFATQAGKGWFTEETFRALARLRGIEANTRYAEAFYCRKLALF
ncbi:MAG: PIG-L family deacetylase [Aphanocapsa lilacina HA4352-LM1]|jgi:LmbE family N-acetylglucosaminyl deacetylase|nr:PIG-L family deacetylase [Aphanocapsa lilacina HA4352-LM1]